MRLGEVTSPFVHRVENVHVQCINIQFSGAPDGNRTRDLSKFTIDCPTTRPLEQIFLTLLGGCPVATVT